MPLASSACWLYLLVGSGQVPPCLPLLSPGTSLCIWPLVLVKERMKAALMTRQRSKGKLPELLIILSETQAFWKRPGYANSSGGFESLPSSSPSLTLEPPGKGQVPDTLQSSVLGNAESRETWS